ELPQSPDRRTHPHRQSRRLSGANRQGPAAPQSRPTPGPGRRLLDTWSGRPRRRARAIISRPARTSVKGNPAGPDQVGGMMPRREGAERDWTKPRSIRVPDDVWEAAKAEAAERDETVSDAVVQFLRRYGSKRNSEVLNR